MHDNFIELDASEQLTQAVSATAGLLTKLRIDFALVGDLALCGWLGRKSEAASLDLLAVVTPEGKQQIPMMASHRGFELDRDLIEATEELDLVPMGLGGVKIHILIASNALYGRMVASAAPARLGQIELRIVNREDLALLLTLSEAPDTLSVREELVRRSRGLFDRDRFNRKLLSIGITGKGL